MDVKRIDGIAIMTDTDNSNSPAEVWSGDIIFSEKQRWEVAFFLNFGLTERITRTYYLNLKQHKDEKTTLTPNNEQSIQ